MKLTVHGCRGSIPISTPQSIIYGGNTSCYELIFNNYQLIFDTGTGFRQVSIDETKKTIIFYSHWHHDHIQGLAFNSGLYNTKKDIFVSSALNNKNESKNIIHQYFSGFYFPLELINKLPNLKFVEFNDLKKDIKKDFKIEFLRLNHPGGSVGYSIIVDEIKFTLLLDNEYDTSQFSSLQEFVNDSNLVVWDGMFTKEELIKKGIWGHSSIEQGIDFFNKCNIKNMLISHHDPLRIDDQLDHFSKKLPKGVQFARDGLKVDFT